MQILQEILTFVKFSARKKFWKSDMTILIINALWEIIQMIVLNPWILRISMATENWDVGIYT